MSSAKYLTLFILISLLGFFSFSFQAPPQGLDAIPEQVKEHYRLQLDSLTTSVLQLEKGIEGLTKRTVESNQELYLQCRTRYKRAEVLLAYYTPQVADQLNGALIDEVEEDDPNQTIIQPEGLQVIEEQLWGDSAWIHKDDILRSIVRIKSVLNRSKTLLKVSTFSNENIFAAMQQEITRIISLGLAGFDCPSSGNAIVECGEAYSGVLQVYAYYQPFLQEQDLALYQRSLLYIQRIKAVFYFEEEFELFNRAFFISQLSNPFYEMLVKTQEKLKIPFVNHLSLRSDAKTLFASDSWNTARYVSYQPRKNSPLVIELGRMLFFDPVISGNKKRACASCHQPEKGFTDGLAKSTAFEFEGNLKRNAPTIINSALQANLFWDSRVNFLEDQVMDVTQNKAEMHGNFSKLVGILNQSPEYVLLFKNAFYGSDDTSISPSSIRKAIAAYERSLVSYNSRFDRYMRGDQSAMTTREIAGFNIFMGKGQCGTCHFLPTFGGTVPPLFERTEWEILGTPKTVEQKEMDNDLGRFNVQGILLHKGAFKTPSLRNVALTGPYMHNGVYTTLNQVIEFYNQGGGAGLGYEVPHQTLPDKKLEFKPKQVAALIAFMNALTDTAGLNKIPNHLPSFPDEELNKRKTGGEY